MPESYRKLGNPQMGVYLNRYFDLEVSQAWNKVGVENPIEIFVFKFCFGNSKLHRVGNVLNLEPTANFDSHISDKKPSETDHDLMKQMKWNIRRSTCMNTMKRNSSPPPTSQTTCCSENSSKKTYWVRKVLVKGQTTFQISKAAVSKRLSVQECFKSSHKGISTRIYY